MPLALLRLLSFVHPIRLPRALPLLAVRFFSLRLLGLLVLLPLGAQAPAWVWSRVHSGSGSAYCFNLAVDPLGYLYTVGYYTTRLDLGPHTLTGGGSNDGYLVKYDAQGTVVWSRAQTGPGQQAATSVVTDAGGAVYVAGNFSGVTTVEGQSLTSAGGTDVFVAKYDTQGTLLWVRSGGGPGNDAVEDLAVAPDGSVYRWVRS